MDRLRLTQPVADKIRAYHLAPSKKKEALSFAHGTGYFTDNGDLVVVVADPADVLLLAPDCYINQGYAHLSVPSDVRSGVVWQGIQKGWPILVSIDFHDHAPFADMAHYSDTDNQDDIRTAIQYRNNLSGYLKEGQSLYAVSVLLGRRQWAARRVVWDGESGLPRFKHLAVDILGENFERHGLSAVLSEPWAVRQRGLISPAQSSAISSMRLVIVGGGGTGSVAVEVAARLGFRCIDIIDHDRIETSNLNRFHGASLADVGKGKAAFLAERAAGLFADGVFRAIATDAFSDAATNALTASDIILGCVDNAETRWYLNRLAVQYAIPYFDCGNLIEVEPDVVLHSRVSVVIPGLTPCGHCSDIEFFPRKIPQAFVDVQTLNAQRAAGYVQDQPADLPAPAIYPLNLQTVSWLMNELLNWICGRSFAHSVYHRSDRNLIERLDSTNYRVGPAEDCSVCSTLLGSCQRNSLPRRGGVVELIDSTPALEIIPHG